MVASSAEFEKEASPLKPKALLEEVDKELGIKPITHKRLIKSILSRENGLVTKSMKRIFANKKQPSVDVLSFTDRSHRT